MSDERPTKAPSDTIATQRKATDPQASAWVSANAGSGKTFVLTRRVIRLLLAGAAPESILCLTYTKAAAAEMRHRVSEILGAWTQLDQDQLAATLSELLGTKPDEMTILRARQLFALALETPGGLKINTIHAFCESVLQRFPFEAGVPVNFSVIEEGDRQQMILDAREAVLATGLKAGDRLGDAARQLFAGLSDHQIEKAVEGALGLGRKLAPILTDIEASKVNLCAFLDVAPDEDLAGLGRRILDGRLVSEADCTRILQLTPPGRAKQKQFEDKLALIDFAAASYEQWSAAFLTGDRTVPRRGFPNKTIVDADPGLAERIEAEAQRLADIDDQWRAVRIARQSSALLELVSAIIARYETEKRARSWLDFDDLVVRTAALFANRDYGAWVRYKLDAGIDHVLVDESQDTNPEQWQVIEALTGDFFDGEGTGRPKTMFAVGDPKQSIYSFQGAEPALFVETGRAMGVRAEQSGNIWHDLTLRTSFRTLGAILEGVDRVANRAEIAAGLLAPPQGVAHESARVHKGGIVDIWPLVTAPDKLDPGEGWPLEPMENLASSHRQLAQRIAGAISHWIGSSAPLGPRGRAIRPEDILVLVQRRSAVFGEIVKALKDERIDSPGADRLPVSAHIAIDDLIGLADILLNPADDLTLAAVLRSPLLGFSEDDLFALANGRAPDVSLWHALRESAAPAARTAFGQLSGLRRRLDLDRPYEFFAHVLYAEDGLKRFHARLGPEVDEVIAEFLDLALEHEQSDQPSLTGFVAAMRRSDVVIKRDLVARASGVRVMTVHGAKGLEAPLVILADAASRPPPVRDCVFTGPSTSPFLLYCSGKDSHCAASMTLRDAIAVRQEQEYWRNLYVAMTRAEDALIVAGVLNDRGKADGSWYAAIESALADNLGPAPAIAGIEGISRFPADGPAPSPVVSQNADRSVSAMPFSLRALPPRQVIERLSPSDIEANANNIDPLAPDTEQLRDAQGARARGIALHALLQHLTRVPTGYRETVAIDAATTLLPEHPELAGPVAAEAMAILDDPAFSAIFGSDARAEVSFALEGTRDGSPIRLSGRIDRLVVGQSAVMVVDFKSDAIVPQSQDDVSEAYWTQLGLYAKVAGRLFPGMPVTTAILWTTTRHLMVLDKDRLSAASATIALV